MLDQHSEAEEFIERFRMGEFDDRLAEALDSLTPKQKQDLLRALEHMPEDLKRSRMKKGRCQKSAAPAINFPTRQKQTKSRKHR